MQSRMQKRKTNYRDQSGLPVDRQLGMIKLEKCLDMNSKALLLKIRGEVKNETKN